MPKGTSAPASKVATPAASPAPTATPAPAAAEATKTAPPAASATTATPAPAPVKTDATSAPAAAAEPTTTDAPVVRPAPAEGDKKDTPPPAAKAKSLSEIKAARRAAEAAKVAPATAATADAGTQKTDTPSDKPATDAKPGDKPPVEAKKDGDPEKDPPPAAPAAAKTPEPVKTDVDDAQLAAFTKLNRDLRAAKETLKTFESIKPLAEQLAKAQELAKKGQHYEAFKAAGLDFDAAAKEVLGLEAEKANEDPALKALRERFETDNKKLREELEALKADKDKPKVDEESPETKALREAAQEEGRQRVIAEVTAAKEAFPYLSRSEQWVRAALAEGDKAYETLKKQYKRDLTDGEKNNLIRATLEEGEAYRASRAKLYTDVKPAATATTASGKPSENHKPTEEPTPAPRTIDPSVRGNTTLMRPRAKKTLSEIKAERRNQNRAN